MAKYHAWQYADANGVNVCSRCKLHRWRRLIAYPGEQWRRFERLPVCGVGGGNAS